MHSNRTKHIVITGANGFIGLTFVNFFSENGHAVTALVRKIPLNQIPNVTYQLYHLESNSEMDFLTPNSIIIHCAYAKKEMVIDAQDVNEFAAIHLLNEAKKHKVEKCIFISSISVASQTDSYYSRQKSKVEALFSEANNLIVRPGLVIGQGGLFYQTISKLKKIKVLPVINGGNQPIYYVGIDDLVYCLADAIEKNATEIQTISHPNAISYKEFYRKASQQLGFKIIALPIPLFVMKFAVFLNSFSLKPILTKDNLKGFLVTPKLEINSKLDFKFQSLPEILNHFKW